MTIIDTGPYTTPYLVHDAPVNEKTKKIRDMFKVDEVTGYPKHYNWRPMARLGNTYKPEDPFRKFDRYNPDEYFSQKVAIVLITGAVTVVGHVFASIYLRRSFLAKSYYSLGIWGATAAFGLYAQEKTLERQGIKNSIVLDYAQKHPERFGTTYRPKVREVLFEFVPIR